MAGWLAGEQAHSRPFTHVRTPSEGFVSGPIAANYSSSHKPKPAIKRYSVSSASFYLWRPQRQYGVANGSRMTIAAHYA
jgi:hypothetical protein